MAAEAEVSELSEIALIYNPNAGRSSNSLLPTAANATLDAARRHLKKSLGFIVPEYPVESPTETFQAARQAMAAGAKLILAAGGDGTVRAAGEALLESDVTLGILPQGTVNVLARELNIPVDDAERAAEIALKGDTVRIDMGKVREQCFLLMCSVGFDAATVASVDQNVKNVIGTGAYVLAGLVNVASYSPVRYTIQADDGPPEEVDAFTILIANAGLYGGDYRVIPDADLTDGLLDVALFTAPANSLLAPQKASFFRQITASMRGAFHDDPDTRHIRCRRIAISSRDKAEVQIDGDPAGMIPITAEILPGALAVRVPAGMHKQASSR